MAVFTNITDSDLNLILRNYGLDSLPLIEFKPIEEGTENSNFFLRLQANPLCFKTSLKHSIGFYPSAQLGLLPPPVSRQQPHCQSLKHNNTLQDSQLIITILEGRSSAEKIEFYTTIHDVLESQIRVPQIYKTTNGKSHTILHGKICIVSSFLEGVIKTTDNILPKDCYEFGKTLAKFHLTTATMKNFDQSIIKNNFFIEKFHEIYQESIQRLDAKNQIHQKHLSFFKQNLNLCTEINNTLLSEKLSCGIIHGDPFPDNVFFKNTDSSEITGFFDFYFACSGYFGYDLAIAVVSWCFDSENHFITERYTSIMAGYSSILQLSELDQKRHTDFIRLACLRFFSTRFLDSLSGRIDTTKKKKDPNDFVKRLECLTAINSHLKHQN